MCDIYSCLLLASSRMAYQVYTTSLTKLSFPTLNPKCIPVMLTYGALCFSWQYSTPLIINLLFGWLGAGCLCPPPQEHGSFLLYFWLPAQHVAWHVTHSRCTQWGRKGNNSTQTNRHNLLQGSEIKVLCSPGFCERELKKASRQKCHFIKAFKHG